MTIKITKTEFDNLAEIAELAEEIWNECFIDIISQGQIDYMVEQFQSLKAMENQVKNDNYSYYGVYFDDKLCGYFGIRLEDEKLFLSKLYLHKDYRGQGIASRMLQTIFEIGRNEGKKSVYLTVNKYNDQAVDVYNAKGFEVIDSVVTDIGEGYVMDDYIFEYVL
ncbi:MAG: GNAT family N-acetyltransferase [Methanobrevibacter sp.]|uniref:GNAT family N-acetyltransferase n=1 Tax=Methanobrevibacter sp. TaxID=66852 RepID=UPI0026E070E6|nr:GNAT family N-acetyltransferase [Methanobrevibacter sp.]MDO5849205.1 GNAT family N-acetyltransferase [Methanobrevibacter sp.]